MLLLPEQIMSERRGEVLVGPHFDDPGATKKSGPQKTSKARRKLDFGPSDDTRSHQFVAELLEKMHEEDKTRWNFDFRNESPSPVGSASWEWTRMVNARRKLDFGGDGSTEEEEDERPKWMFQILEKLHREQVERWNFDFREERPLNEGDWEWTKFGEEEEEEQKKNDDDSETKEVHEGAPEATRKRTSSSAGRDTVTSEGESSTKLPRIEERTG